MSEIKIFVSHSPDRDSIRIKNPLFYHVIAGSVFQTKPKPEGLFWDNRGDHISYKNRAYCELTTQYWAWKNVKADYYGFCHYRRYFSFSPRNMRESDCGCLVYPYLNRYVQKLLCINRKKIEEKVRQYDFLIAKGISVYVLGAKNVYEHYKKAVGLKEEDLVLFYRILRKRYPQLRSAAEAYLKGRIFYPCNMFIMRKELFIQYSQMLFTILEEFEQQADMNLYSKEACRTPGHLGERFAGIYFTYLRQQGGYRLGELQMAMIAHTQAETFEKPSKGEIPVVFAANQSYVPVLYVCIKSLTECLNPARQYHLYVFHTDLMEEHRQIFRKGFTAKNIRIDFVDVGVYITGYSLKAKEHITKETFYRFLILDILKDCPKAVYLDADLIVQRDIAQLYDEELGECLLGAVTDPDFAGQCNGANIDTKRYCKEVLKLKDPFGYIQAGVLVLNISELNKTTSAEALMQMAGCSDYMYSDQDILNIICQGRIKKLDMAWNVMTCSRGSRAEIIQAAPADILYKYEQSRKEPYIIHYAGGSKPWKNLEGDMAGEFWRTARQTPFYEELLYCMCSREKKPAASEKAVRLLKRSAKKILPQGSFIRKMAVRLYWKLK